MLKQFAYICILKLVQMEMKSKATDLGSNWSMGSAIGFSPLVFFLRVSESNIDLTIWYFDALSSLSFTFVYIHNVCV